MSVWKDPSVERPPMMEEVLLRFAGGVTIGWDEAYPHEQVAWCTREDWWKMNNRVPAEIELCWEDTVTGWFPIPHSD